MSARSAKQPKALPGLVLGGEPRVNLLPPEVAQASKARATRVRLSLLVVLAIVAVGAGYGFAMLRAADAQAQLLAAQDRTSALLAEQLQYSEASSVAGLVQNSEAVLTLATSTEVVWSDVVADIAPLLPPDVIAIRDLTGTARAPWSQPLPPLGPLRQAREATLQIVAWSTSPVDATTLNRRLESLEYFGDASIDLVELIDTHYETTITLNLNELALANRFAEEVSE